MKVRPVIIFWPIKLINKQFLDPNDDGTGAFYLLLVEN